MAVKINEVQITPSVVTVGEPITITITAVDVTWEVIKDDFSNWEAVKNDFTNWNSIINYH